MKPIVRILPLILPLLILFTACTEEEKTGLVKFGMEMTGEAFEKSSGEPEVTMAAVTIRNADGSLLYDKEPLELLRFGDLFVTRSLELPVGEYQVDEFMLMNTAGEVLWATPRLGSPLAHLVRYALPYPFAVHPEETTRLDLEVIRVGNRPPSEFGYAEFSVTFVHSFCLQVQYDHWCPDPWTDSLSGGSGEDFPYYQPKLLIRSGNRTLLEEPLKDGLHRYRVPLVREPYRVSATNCHGDTFYHKAFSPEELIRYGCGDGTPPLVISHHPDSTIIITPEGLHEPTIRQGVFGWVELPVDSYMVDDPDIWPVHRDIYFFPHSVWDSVYTFAPMGCRVSPDLVPPDPVAIVRTNSDGVFQVPLEAGEYLYLVKDEEWFYVDAYISSRVPGYVRVYPLEVTELYIAMIDCSMVQ